MSKENITQALIDEEITTKEDIENVNWENIVPKEPKLDVLEREDEEIYEWFYDYIEFYDEVRFHSFRKNISQEAMTYHLMSEDVYNNFQEVPLKYSNKPIPIFLWSNKKLINNSIYASGTGGYGDLSPEDAFTLGEFTGLTKEDNKIIFEFTNTSNEHLSDSWLDIGIDENYKMKFELYFKDDNTFRVGEMKIITENRTF